MLVWTSPTGHTYTPPPQNTVTFIVNPSDANTDAAPETDTDIPPF